jgi:hypothetical protein
MGVAVFALGIMGWAFVRGGIEDIVKGVNREREYDTIQSDERLAMTPLKGEGDHSWGKIKRLLSNPLILALMMWSFFYVSISPLWRWRTDDQAGAESSVSGYLVSPSGKR